MSNPVASLCRASTRRPEEPLNILCMPTHERTETNLCQTGHRFWAIRSERVKDWNTTYAPVPDNYVLLNPARGENQLPPDIDFDLVLSQNKAGQYDIARRLASMLHLPLVSLEHTLPHPDWPVEVLERLKQQTPADVHVFISEYSRRKWGYESEGLVVHHGVDTNTFLACPGIKRQSHVLSVVNDFFTPERRWCCGAPFWQEATRGLPTLHVGSDPEGRSQPAKDVNDLVRHYQQCAVFVDSASASPIPTVVLEAMACGCVVVSRGNAMVPEIIEDGVNGFICPDERSMRKRLMEVLANPDGFDGMRARARQTICDRFSLSVFVSSWDRVLRQSATIIFRGG